jgi:hypothetical protein
MAGFVTGSRSDVHAHLIAARLVDDDLYFSTDSNGLSSLERLEQRRFRQIGESEIQNVIIEQVV